MVAQHLSKTAVRLLFGLIRNLHGAESPIDVQLDRRGALADRNHAVIDVADGDLIALDFISSDHVAMRYQFCPGGG